MEIVSIILTSYNKPRTVGLAIESVINQTFRNWELFIMDDNSDQETVHIIKKYLDHPDIHYHNSNIKDSERYKTTRYATLINNAIPLSKGTYLTYLTDDNIYLPNRLEEMTKFFSKFPKLDIVYSEQQVQGVEQNGKISWKGTRKAKNILTNPVGLVDHCSVMHTRRIADLVFQKFGSYWDDDPSVWQFGDAAFWKRLTAFQPFYPIPKILDIAYKTPQSFQTLNTHLPSHLPDGTLVRALLPDVYLIDNQLRRRISSTAFSALKYDSNQIVDIPDPFLFKYKEGLPLNKDAFSNPWLFPNMRLVYSSTNNQLYYIQQNKKHPINDKLMKEYKFDLRQAIKVDDQLLGGIPEGGTFEAVSKTSLLPDGILFFDGKDYYLSMKNKLHPIDKVVIIKLRLPVSEPVNLDEEFKKKFKQGEPFSWSIQKRLD
ncbi:spore maturation protein CgeD [Bacillus tianshenii]|uniref:Spore maturation protein CgeD n=1 Tax=Sutcliffiella tianshenii TaxID=1463404 RepID=A0ABS2P549_9BACI|nr:glycosyltransferase family 2 protein [Bacillus tianshenii]MBM7622081.1 spore maturation protein CgeD [Bacillus tianshenii]